MASVLAQLLILMAVIGTSCLVAATLDREDD